MDHALWSNLFGVVLAMRKPGSDEVAEQITKEIVENLPNANHSLHGRFGSSRLWPTVCRHAHAIMGNARTGCAVSHNYQAGIAVYSLYG